MSAVCSDLKCALWHDLECGSYTADLPLWRTLATQAKGPILEIGAGTGRVALDLARRGHAVTALDHDPTLLAVLERRAAGVKIETVAADARCFELEARFALCLVPMQTLQLLGGPGGRAAFFRCAHDHLLAGGLLAAALTTSLEPYELRGGAPAPVPDMCERDGVVYLSRPTAVRVRRKAFVLERRRETVAVDGRRAVERSQIALDRVTVAEVEHEAGAAGLAPVGRDAVPATRNYAGSEVVIVGA